MLDLFIKALRFASDKHMTHRRKGCDSVPYINHLIKVAEILYTIGDENNEEILAAAILHDTLEDTDTTFEELNSIFGTRIAELVREVTDDMSLSYEDRKRHQIKNAIFISNDARKLKIADKISNIKDILELPLNWSNRRKRQYIDWAEQVITNCRGVNPKLDQAFDEILLQARTAISLSANNQNEPTE